jgi:hypothetical protein
MTERIFPQGVTHPFHRFDSAIRMKACRSGSGKPVRRRCAIRRRVPPIPQHGATSARTKNRRRDDLSSYPKKVHVKVIYLAAGFFFAAVAGAAVFFATFLAGAFFAFEFAVLLVAGDAVVVFFAGAFFAGISYPPFPSAVAES